jgi:hypothetical protein
LGLDTRNGYQALYLAFTVFVLRLDEFLGLGRFQDTFGAAFSTTAGSRDPRGKGERNMPSKRLKLTQEQVAIAKETLDAIPAAPKELRPITVSEAIRSLTPTIRRLIDRGHTREAVLGFLKQQGIECSPSTFKECYRPGRGKSAAKPAGEGEGGAPTTTVGTAGQPSAGNATQSVATKPTAGPSSAAPSGGPAVARPAADSRAEQRPMPGLQPAVAKAS